jgi:two-component system, NtrC family, sensor kinase
MDLAEAFEAAGFDAVPCASLAEAREALATGKADLLVLDAQLPDGDGVDLLRELRDSQSRPLPVLMLSSEAEATGRTGGTSPAADAYIGKPYDAGDVVSKARELLAASRTGAAPEASILIIGDSETYRRRLAEILEAAGYHVLSASNGRAGLAILADRRPSAVIVDGVMPDMDGATLIRRVRLDAATRGLPCILLTASEDTGAQLRALEAGADAFVRKDDEMDVVLARLATVLRRQASHPVGPLTSLSGPRKILAVDDSETYLNEIAEALRHEGYEVLLARSGEEALDLLAVQPVDCILMDLMMPGIGGKEACARIKSAAGVRDIPLILLTAHDDRTAMLEGLSAGADDHISKSSEFEVLCARVLAQIRRKQFEDENRRYREELLEREIAAGEERSARVLAEARAAMVDELQRTIVERTRELEASIVGQRHAERMASVGMLSASIAHEINNPLAIVIGNLELVRLSLTDLASHRQGGNDSGDPSEPSLGTQFLERVGSPDDPLRDALDAAERVRQIVRDLRIFSRSEEEGPRVPVDVRKVLESTFRMASNEVRHRARLVTSLADVPSVEGSESRLGQVFLNLIVNAAQAMPIGQVSDNEIRVSTSLDGKGSVLVEVADTGVGIPEEKLARVFDPFFTTKPAGVGTGLGLAICHRIVTELGGTIAVASVVGQGTTFRVSLPIAANIAGTQESAPHVPTQVAASAASHSRILVVDDEASLCRTIGRILSGRHDVTVATSAIEALTLIETGKRFDLILSDLMMPEMSGMDLHTRLVDIAPGQAACMIFMSGGAFSADAESFLDAQPFRIEKPFLPSALLGIVDRALVQTRLAA